MEKRTHDAISFYTKAANDPQLKPMIDFILRNMKEHCPITSVQNRLALYDLAQQDNFNYELNLTSKAQLGFSAPLLLSFGMFVHSANSQSIDVRITTKFEI